MKKNTVDNINIIVAARHFDNAIGYKNNLLYEIKEDLRYFKEKTEGEIVVFGSSTYLSLPNYPLKNRDNYVLSNKLNEVKGATVLKSVEEVINLANKNKDKKVFICGGESLYKQFLDISKTVYITVISEGPDVKADTFFPFLNEEWILKSIYAEEENLCHEHSHFFCRYERN